MKRVLSIISIMLLMFTFVGCGKGSEKTAQGYAKTKTLIAGIDYSRYLP